MAVREAGADRDGTLRFRRFRNHRSDEFDETGHDPDNQSQQIQPRRVQVMIESQSNQPTRDRTGGEYDGKLAVLRHLQPEALVGIVVVGNCRFPFVNLCVLCGERKR